MDDWRRVCQGSRHSGRPGIRAGWHGGGTTRKGKAELRRSEAQWVSDDAKDQGDANASYGAGRALLEANWDFDLVDIADDWSGYRCLIASDNGVIDRALADRLASHVQAGGSLVLVGALPWRDAGARAVLEELSGVDYEGRGAFSSCFLAAHDGSPAHYVSGPYVRLRARPGTEALAEIVRPFDDLDTPPSSRATTLRPGCRMATSGSHEADVVTIAASLGRDYWVSGNPDLRRLLVGALRTVVPERYVELESPSPLIEVSLMHQDGQWVVHLLQQTPNRSTGALIIEDTPVRREVAVTIRPPYPVGGVVRIPSGDDVAPHQRCRGDSSGHSGARLSRDVARREAMTLRPS